MTVSLPVRRRASSRRTGVAGFLTSGRAPRRGAVAGSSSSSTGTATLPAAASAATFAAAALPARSATSRREFFLFAPLRLLFGSLARLLFGAAARLFLFDLSARFFLGPLARLVDGAFFLLATPIRFGESGQATRFLVGLAGILHGARAPARSSAVSVRAITTGRRAGSVRCRPRRRLVARHRRRRLGPAGLGQPRADHALLANLDGDRLRASVREALAHLRRLDRFAKLQPAAATAERQRPLLLLLRRVLLLLVRFAHLDPIPPSCCAGRGCGGFRPSID